MLLPVRVRRAVRTRFDARYVARADHRQDVRDALWEARSLRREVVALRGEVERFRRQIAAATAPDPALAGRADEAQRLARESACAMDHLLQNEVLLWQAVDRLETRVERLEPEARSVPEPAAKDADPGGFASCA
jgi:phage shock protein A